MQNIVPERLPPHPNVGSARLFGALAEPLRSPGMAYWMITCSVYLYIATLEANVHICRSECDERSHEICA